MGENNITTIDAPDSTIPDGLTWHRPRGRARRIRKWWDNMFSAKHVEEERSTTTSSIQQSEGISRQNAHSSGEPIQIWRGRNEIDQPIGSLKQERHRLRFAIRGGNCQHTSTTDGYTPKGRHLTNRRVLRALAVRTTMLSATVFIAANDPMRFGTTAPIIGKPVRTNAARILATCGPCAHAWGN